MMMMRRKNAAILLFHHLGRRRRAELFARASSFRRRHGIVTTTRSGEEEEEEDNDPYLEFLRTRDVKTEEDAKTISKLVKTLDALKYAMISPETKVGMFPLMMPLGVSPFDGNAIGFLLEPSLVVHSAATGGTQERKEIISLGPIVKSKTNQKQLEFVSKDATTFLRRVLLEEEVNAVNRGGLMPVRDSILRSSSSSSGSSSSNAEHAEHDRETLARLAASKHMLNAYMTQKIGSFPDIIENLIARHEFVKKDETSALVACEFYINREEFTNKWARPYAVNARTLRRFENRESEARDAARIALSVAPWFTVGGGYGGGESGGSNLDVGGEEENAILPSLTGATLEDMKKLVNMDTMDAKSAKDLLEGVGTEIAKEHEKNAPEMSEEGKALKRCFDILDYVSWGNEKGYESWDSIREELSESYEKAGMKRFAELVKPEGDLMN
jgi:hypothetical protein